MRKFLIPQLIILLSAVCAYGEVSVSGYFEPQLSVTILDDDLLQLNSNKLRVDLKSDLSSDLTFTGNFNYINYNGKKVWNLLDFLPEKLASKIPQDSTHLYSLKYEDQNKLDNAYLRFYSKLFTLTLGRQQLSVGSGYAWNPTDLFNAKDILDPTYEQPGVNGIRLDVGISADHTVQIFYSPEDKWENSGKLLRFLGRISHFDYALSAGAKEVKFTDYHTFYLHEKSREILGLDVNGEMLGVGCWSENSFNLMENSKDYWENLVGIDYTFSSGWYVMAEYYHNGGGKKNFGDYSLDDWMRYFTAETKTISCDQLYLYSLYPAGDLINLGGSAVYSISDRSFLLVPTLEYSIKNDLILTFFGNIYAGKEGTMYSKDLGKGGMVRLRAYF